MLRALAISLSLLITGAAIVPAAARADAPAGEVTFPLPADATRNEGFREGKPTADKISKGGDGRIVTYNVPRGRTAVTDEVRASLKKGKWEILKDEPSPSGNATRIQAKKGGKLFKVSFTGDKDRTVIILTLP